MNDYIKSAQLLVEALPYIKKFHNKTIVIKYGGNAMINNELENAIIEDITLLKFVGINPIVIHGGGPDINSALDIYNIKSEFIDGLRKTTPQAMSIIQQVLAGKINKNIVGRLNQKGAKAIGLCGIDGNLITCRPLNEGLGCVGEVKGVNTKLLTKLTDDEYIPVIAPLGTDSEGNVYNINADTAACEIAKSLGAHKLMFVTNVKGVLDADENVIAEINEDRINDMIKNGSLSGGMIPKMESSLNAIKNGVKRVHIIDGHLLHCIILELFTDKGIGTMIKE
ncbi:MAG: acetylglutamate kinase [Clostridiales bacterium]|jgi:acetylglutamate kinase|nr:acetylglutamate kinase [Clostridiales bacterium]